MKFPFEICARKFQHATTTGPYLRIIITFKLESVLLLNRIVNLDESITTAATRCSRATRWKSMVDANEMCGALEGCLCAMRAFIRNRFYRPMITLKIKMLSPPPSNVSINFVAAKCIQILKQKKNKILFTRMWRSVVWQKTRYLYGLGRSFLIRFNINSMRFSSSHRSCSGKRQPPTLGCTLPRASRLILIQLLTCNCIS